MFKNFQIYSQKNNVNEFQSLFPFFRKTLSVQFFSNSKTVHAFSKVIIKKYVREVKKYSPILTMLTSFKNVRRLE